MDQDDKFKFLNHPSDIKMQAFGKDLAELFSNAAFGMMTFLYPKKVGIKEFETKKEIRLKTDDLKSLLIDWLSEVLYFSETFDCCFNIFTFQELKEDELVSTIYGHRIVLRQKIKEIIHQDSEIKKISDRWQAIILFDI